MGYSGAGGKLIHEKNQKQKISWHCPFKLAAEYLMATTTDQTAVDSGEGTYVWDYSQNAFPDVLVQRSHQGDTMTTFTDGTRTGPPSCQEGRTTR
jgi:hypothetical protein